MTGARKEVTIFTDGACSGNPGAGGWAAVLRFGGHERELAGGERETTNNRMELTAAIAALSALREPCSVLLHTDSQYIVRAFNDGWLDAWRARGWRKADKAPVKNADLWQRLDALVRGHDVHFIWVRGHNGQPENERCDELAVAQSEKYKSAAME